MVFVAVGNQDGPDPVGIFEEVGDIGNDEVHAREVLRGKLDAAVDDNDVVTAFQGHHVFADFTEAAEGYDAKFRIQSK